MLLAWLGEDALQETVRGYRYRAYTEKSNILSTQDLMKELEIIRRRGYAEDLEAHEIGLTCYAAPVFDYAGSCAAAISTSGRTAVMEKEHKRIVDHLLRVSDALSRELGYQGGPHTEPSP